jgi:large subunit ribosomal protein L23
MYDAKMESYQIILAPYVNEKSMNFMEKDQNKLEFHVRMDATKAQIKRAVETRFKVNVIKINTYIYRDGKHAIVKLSAKDSAQDVGTRIGVF